MNILGTGLKGFAAFFSLILVVKFSLFFIDESNSLDIEILDVYQSLLGVVLFILNKSSKILLSK